ncbi:MAG: alkaline phosphatase family protein [Acidobacteriota bacterium]
MTDARHTAHPDSRPWRTPAWFDVVAAGFLPGLLFGIQLTGLIFFLNPGLPFDVAPVARGAGIYGGGLGLLTLAASLPFLWGRRQRARRFLPWALTVALAAAALFHWIHASRFNFFLPPGINIRLIKASALLSFSALVAFYTALLHSLQDRRYGVRSLAGFVILSLASVYFVMERRDAFRPRIGPAPRVSTVAEIQRPRLLLVGLDGATLDALLPAAGQGNLPFLDHALRNGAYGRLTSFGPFRRKSLWTTLATGKLPYKHGLVSERIYPAPLLAEGGQIAILPAGLAFQHWGTLGRRGSPSDGTERRALALWEVLPRLGMTSSMLGWPASAPVSEDPNQAISERFFSAPRQAGVARPTDIAERARIFRLRQDELDPQLTARFGPSPNSEVLTALAGDLWRDSLGQFFLAAEPPPEALMMVLDGLAGVSESAFGGFAAARIEGLHDGAYSDAAETLEAYYAYCDQAIAGLWEAIPEPKLLAVVSAYGAGAPAGWARNWRELASEPWIGGSFRGSPDGVLLLYGEGIRQGSLLTGAGLVDVLPTLMYGLGLPIAQDLDGRVITAAFDRSFLAGNPLTFLPSYEALTPPSRRPPPAAPLTPLTLPVAAPGGTNTR